MSLRLIQIVTPNGARQLVAIRDGAEARAVTGVSSTYELAQAAIKAQVPIDAQVDALGLGAEIDIETALAEGRVLAPIDHPDPAHLHVTGTGLTHLGSAEGRHRMHEAAASGDENLTDTMRMFLMGMKGGKPDKGQVGAQPEWFYKGNGHTLVGPGGDLESPAFAGDGGEEPEIAGIYIIGGKGSAYRIGYALANEFSDHVVEKQNYLWLAHSKLRPAAIGVEILTGELPKHIAGTSRIWRGDDVIWEKPFISGEDNMSHSLANLEHHHFKYDIFRKPWDVHVHCFGTATASFADGVKTQDGDVFEITADAFDYGLRNSLRVQEAKELKIKIL
jgi:hypothetical protein